MCIDDTNSGGKLSLSLSLCVCVYARARARTYASQQIMCILL